MKFFQSIKEVLAFLDEEIAKEKEGLDAVSSDENCMPTVLAVEVPRHEVLSDDRGVNLWDADVKCVRYLVEEGMDQ